MEYIETLREQFFRGRLLQEQGYSSSKKYYIGRWSKRPDNFDLSTEKTIIPTICVTTKLEYAAPYALTAFGDNKNGIVYQVKLNKGLEIFNTKSKGDLLILKNAYEDKYTPNILNQLSRVDWNGIKDDSNNFINRDEILLDITKLVKNKKTYDGIFNYESRVEYPSLILFKKNLFTVKEEFGYDAIFKELKELKKKETETLIHEAANNWEYSKCNSLTEQEKYFSKLYGKTNSKKIKEEEYQYLVNLNNHVAH